MEKQIRKVVCPYCSCEFSKKSNRQKYCSKDCQFKGWYEKNKKRLNENRNRWQKNNREKGLMWQKKWREKNKLKRQKDWKKWREENPESILEYGRKYRLKKINKIRSKVRLEGLKDIKEEVIKKRGMKCEKCGHNKNIDLHHTKYINREKFVLLLCRSCHKKTHIRQLKIVK